MPAQIPSSTELRQKAWEWMKARPPRSFPTREAIRAAALMAGLPENADDGWSAVEAAGALQVSVGTFNGIIHYERNHPEDYEGFVVLCKPSFYDWAWLYWKSRDPAEVKRWGQRLLNTAQTLTTTAHKAGVDDGNTANTP